MAFCLEECKQNDIEFIWHRDKKWKTPKRTIPDMKVIKEYCDDEFIFVNKISYLIPLQINCLEIYI